MRVTAGDGQSRLGDAKLGPDDMDDALAVVVDAVMGDAVDARILFKQTDHVARVGVFRRFNTALAANRRHVMISHREILCRFAHLAALFGQRAEGME